MWQRESRTTAKFPALLDIQNVHQMTGTKLHCLGHNDPAGLPTVPEQGQYKGTSPASLQSVSAGYHKHCREGCQLVQNSHAIR